MSGCVDSLKGKSLGADFGKLCFNPRIQLGKTVHYLPILFIDQLSNRVKDLMVSDTSARWSCSWRDTDPKTGPAAPAP